MGEELFIMNLWPVWGQYFEVIMKRSIRAIAGGGARKTLKYAFSKLKAGDSLLVANGDYNELGLIVNFTGGVTKFNNNILCSGYTQFVNPTASSGYDFHLKSTSPLINAGYNSNTSATDLEGLTGPINGAVDAGCYEYSPPTYIQPGAFKSLRALVAPTEYGNLFSVNGKNLSCQAHVGVRISKTISIYSKE